MKEVIEGRREAKIYEEGVEERSSLPRKTTGRDHPQVEEEEGRRKVRCSEPNKQPYMLAHIPMSAALDRIHLSEKGSWRLKR